VGAEEVRQVWACGGIACDYVHAPNLQGAPLHHGACRSLEDEFSAITVSVVSDDAFLPVPVEQVELGPQGF
jgi:hypothetical protein